MNGHRGFDFNTSYTYVEAPHMIVDSIAARALQAFHFPEIPPVDPAHVRHPGDRLPWPLPHMKPIEQHFGSNPGLSWPDVIGWIGQDHKSYPVYDLRISEVREEGNNIVYSIEGTLPPVPGYQPGGTVPGWSIDPATCNARHCNHNHEDDDCEHCGHPWASPACMDAHPPI